MQECLRIKEGLTIELNQVLFCLMIVKGVANPSFSRKENGKKDQEITCRVLFQALIKFTSCLELGSRNRLPIHCGGRKLDFACNSCRSSHFVCQTSTFAIVSLSSDSRQAVCQG